ncbi:MAG: TetR/AcrR family transcriptional regulator [gamma proteobacterium symbiont of Taylorina sp.]|nr:TetR/AcrR family transcriptional regulator [gamma proteobacterium symbiont of Taylorina sp.]
MKQGNETKIRILTVANELFYHQGFNSTSIANIVDKTKLSKGNITYHFKSKQAILEGIVEQRLLDIDGLLNQWDMEIIAPLDRLLRFCGMLIDEQDNLKYYGCPMGTLTGELSKNQPIHYKITLPMFKRFRSWLTQQFLLLNYPPEQSDENAMELLSRVQGISVITHVFKDKEFLNKEIKKLKETLHIEYGGGFIP